MKYLTAEIRPIVCRVNTHLTGRSLEVLFRERDSENPDNTTIYCVGTFREFDEATAYVRDEMKKYGYRAVVRNHHDTH